MPFGFWYIFQDDMIACEPPQVREISYKDYEIHVTTIMIYQVIRLYNSISYWFCLVSTMRTNIWSNLSDAS